MTFPFRHLKLIGVFLSQTNFSGELIGLFMRLLNKSHDYFFCQLLYMF